MDDPNLKKILFQLRFLNFFVALFGTLIIVGLIIGGLAVYKVVTVANNSIQKIDSFQQQTKQSLDLQQQLCKNSSAKALLQSQTDLCK